MKYYQAVEVLGDEVLLALHLLMDVSKGGSDVVVVGEGSCEGMAVGVLAEAGGA